VSAASLIGGLATNIQNPANQDIEQKLHASPSEISWSLSLFILVQGNFPLVWAAISEIKGRKVSANVFKIAEPTEIHVHQIVYLVSYSIFVVGSIIVATAQSIGLIIGMRGLQAAGYVHCLGIYQWALTASNRSSAVFAIGAATLADIYDPVVRGSKFGVYYASPLLGPSLAPLVSGILTQAFGWRAVFWFLAIAASINFFLFLFLLKETFRRQRSLVFQTILKKRMRTQEVSVTEEHKSVSIRTNNDTPTADVPEVSAEITLSLTDVNPIPPCFRVLQRWNNIAILVPSGKNPSEDCQSHLLL
jgi:MFS family permease